MSFTTAKPIRIARLAGVGLALVFFGLDAGAQHMAGGHADHAAMDHGAAMPDMNATGEIVVGFDLVNRDGESVTEKDFRGQYVLLGFGFTHCEHICPLMGLHIGQAVDASPVPTTGIFVSVDTERDTAAVSDDYASHFSDSMIGLGGSIEQINKAAKNFKVSYAVTKTQDTYTVQHTANIFLIDPAGKLADVFSFTASAEELLEAIH